MKNNGITTSAKGALHLAVLLGASTLAMGGQDAVAQTQAAVAASSDTVTVEADRLAREGPKYAAPLLDTPQTITVVPKEVIEQQNLLNLRDVLQTLPGITFGAGEGGGGYGDSINLRGFSASNDVTIDGVRDSAQYNRSDPFNLDQISLSNGASSVYNGAGSIAGNINLVSKTPTGAGRTAVSIGAGTDAYGRITADADHEVIDGVALRVNVMMHQNDVPDRDVEQFQRFGIAPSIKFGLDGNTQFTLSYFHQSEENTPQYGIPYALNAFSPGPLVGYDRSGYYGYSNLDTQEIDVDYVTGVLEHTFSDALTLRNLTRAQKVSQYTITSAVQGTFCVAPGINPYTGAACAAPAPAVNNYAPAGPRGNLRDTENELLYNQTDITWKVDTGPFAHTIVAGVSLSHETYELKNGSVLRNSGGALPNPTLPLLNLANPVPIYSGPVNAILAGQTESTVDNRALYVFDAIELTPHWELNGGVRVERNEAESRIDTFATPATGGAVTRGPVNKNEDDLLSWRVGVVFKPADNASIYAAYGNSQTPSQPSVTVINAAAGCVAASCNIDPEEAENIEIGTKWDAMDGRLSLTAALFRNERTNYRVPSNDPADPAVQLNGQSRVDGVALGAAGLLTDNWSIFANYTFLDSEVLQGVSNFCLANPGAAGCALGGNNAIAGDPLPVTPEHSFSLWTTYELRRGLLLGYGATYQGEYTFARTSTAQPFFYTDDYWVHRAMISYPLTDHVSLQLNVNNLADETYFIRVRNNATSGWATPGDGRQFVLSANMRF